MTTFFSNFFSCCNRNNNENTNEFNNNNDFRKESNNNSYKSKSKNNNNSLSKNNNTNFETMKKNYSFIKSLDIEDKKSNNIIEETKLKNNTNIINKFNNNNNNNNKIIFINDKKDKKNNNNISCDQISISNEKNNSSLQKQEFNDNFKILTSNNINTKNEMNISNDNNGGSISKIEDNSVISSKNSSSIKNLTNIFSKSKQNLMNANTNISNNENLNITNNINSKKNSNKNLLKKSSIKVIDYKSTLNLDFDNIILDEEIELAPKLLISDINESKLFNGNVIEIDAAGSLKGFRQKRDGMTFFGIKNDNNNNNNNNLERVNNDIIINFKKKVSIDKLFVIFYDRKKGIYYIQNLNRNIKLNKYFMYVKIFYEFYLNEDEEYQTIYCLLGQLLMSITIENENNLLNIKLYNSNNIKNNSNHKSNNNSKIEDNINIEDSNINKNYKEYNYLPENDSIITIGRENCTINLVNKYISRVHCSIIYDKFKNKWYICDGNGKGKYSSHGTWLILNNNIKFPLYTYNENYQFKTGEQMFNIQIKNE